MLKSWGFEINYGGLGGFSVLWFFFKAAILKPELLGNML